MGNVPVLVSSRYLPGLLSYEKIGIAFQHTGTTAMPIVSNLSSMSRNYFFANEK